MLNDNVQVCLRTKSPVQELRIDLTEFIAMLGPPAPPEPTPASAVVLPFPADISDRVAALERNIIEIATEPMRDSEDGDDLDLPAFMRRPGERRPSNDSQAARDTADRLATIERRLVDLAMAIPTPADTADRMAAIERRLTELSIPTPPALPGPVQQLAANSVLDRVTAIERRLDAQRSAPPAPPVEPDVLTPIEHIQSAARQAIRRVAPPLQVVEAAHLARAQQERPLALMERVGRAMGVGWEDAATTIIRRHDRAAHIATEAYAIEIEANARLIAGEPANAIVTEAIKAIEAIGGE